MSDSLIELSPAIPSDALVVQLRDNAKEPASAHGHRSGVPIADFPHLGRNVGIVLDHKFLVVDIDNPNAEPARFLERRLSEYTTWQQKTGHGRHYLFRTPPGFSGTNTALKDENGARYADIKTLGYIVAPNSLVVCDKPCNCGELVYSIERDIDPQIAPDWVLKLAFQQKNDEKSVTVEQNGIPYGEHDQFLIAYAGWLRGRYGLAEDTIRHAISGALGVLEGYDETHPYTETDFERIARSAARYATPDGDIGPLMPERWIAGDTVELITDPERWWVPGILPAGHLTMVYGAGGTGKSTFGSWLAHRVTAQGGTFVAYCIEESFVTFLRRAVLGGAERSLIFGAQEASGVMLPRDAKGLRAAFEEARVDVVYFDSIASHMDGTPGLNIAERTRKSLAPLAEIAQSLGIAVVAVFHENKAGDFGGSVEMLNVSRHVLHLRRRPGHPLQAYAKKTNLACDENVVYRFEGDRTPVADPKTGQVQQILTPDGLKTMETHILREIDPVSLDDAEMSWNTENDLLLDNTPARRGKLSDVEAMVAIDPNVTANEIALGCGLPLDKASKLLERIQQGDSL